MLFVCVGRQKSDRFSYDYVYNAFRATLLTVRRHNIRVMAEQKNQSSCSSSSPSPSPSPSLSGTGVKGQWTVFYPGRDLSQGESANSSSNGFKGGSGKATGAGEEYAINLLVCPSFHALGPLSHAEQVRERGNVCFNIRRHTDIISCETITLGTEGKCVEGE